MSASALRDRCARQREAAEEPRERGRVVHELAPLARGGAVRTPKYFGSLYLGIRTFRYLVLIHIQKRFGTFWYGQSESQSIRHLFHQLPTNSAQLAAK